MNYSEITITACSSKSIQKNEAAIEKMLSMLPNNSNSEFLLHDCETQILYKCILDGKTLFVFIKDDGLASHLECPTLIIYSVSYGKDKYVKIINPTK